MVTTVQLRSSFNTQPPEGGCNHRTFSRSSIRSFNTQPPEGGCQCRCRNFYVAFKFQHTAARRRLLHRFFQCSLARRVSTHNRTKAAAVFLAFWRGLAISFNTQPHEGGCKRKFFFQESNYSFNTQPHEGGCLIILHTRSVVRLFQHTAARRRLPLA